MDFLRLKEKSAHKFIQNQLKKTGNLKKVIPQRLTKIGIVVDEDLWESHDPVKKLSGLFKIPEPYFKALIVKKDKNGGPTTHAQVSDKDLKLFGKIGNAEVNSFLDIPFDLLIVYTSLDPVLNRLLLVRSKALLKSGFYNADFPFYDISIKIPDDQFEKFNAELLRYLKIMELLS